MVSGAVWAAPRVLRVGEGADAVLDALEVSPPDPGVDVAVGCPAGAGSLVLLGLFPQPATKMHRLAMNGNANFRRILGLTRFSPNRKAKSVALRGAARGAVPAIVIMM